MSAEVVSLRETVLFGILTPMLCLLAAAPATPIDVGGVIGTIFDANELLAAIDEVLPVIPILADNRLEVIGVLAVDMRIIAGGLPGVLGIIDGGSIAGFVKFSTDLETSPFFSVLMRMIDERLHPDAELIIDSSNRGCIPRFFGGPGVFSKNSFASIHCSVPPPCSKSNSSRASLESYDSPVESLQSIDDTLPLKSSSIGSSVSLVLFGFRIF